MSYDLICNSGGAQLFTSSWFPSHRRAHQRAKAKRFSRSLCLLHRPSRRNKLTVSVCASVTSAFQTSVIGCEDVDDALSCVKLKNGNFSVGVPPLDSTPQCTIDETWDELRWGPHCRCDQLCKTWFSLRSRGAVCGQSGQCLFGCIKLWTTVDTEIVESISVYPFKFKSSHYPLLWRSGNSSEASGNPNEASKAVVECRWIMWVKIACLCKNCFEWPLPDVHLQSICHDRHPVQLQICLNKEAYRLIDLLREWSYNWRAIPEMQHLIQQFASCLPQTSPCRRLSVLPQCTWWIAGWQLDNKKVSIHLSLSLFL